MSIRNHSSLSDDNYSLFNKNKFTYKQCPYSTKDERHPPIYTNSLRNKKQTCRDATYQDSSKYNTISKDYRTIVKDNMMEWYKRNTNRKEGLSLLEGYHDKMFLNGNFQINMRMFNKYNELTAVKNVIEKQLHHNRELLQMESDYCEKMKKVNEELVQQINEFAYENEKLNYERTKLQMDYAAMEEDINYKLLYLINTTQRAPKLKHKGKESENQKQENEDSEDESIRESQNRYKLLKDKIYSLTFSQTNKKLYEIRKKILEDELSKEQKQLHKKIRNKTFRSKYPKTLFSYSTIRNENDNKDEMTNANTVDKENVEKFQTIQPNNKMNINIRTSSPVIKKYSVSVRKPKSLYKHFKVTKPINENTVLDDLSSINITNEEKLYVLQKTIQKIYEYAKLCKRGTIIYKESHTKTVKYKKEIRFLYEQIKLDQNINVNVDLLPMLIFEILHSNYQYNLNPQTLNDKQDYNETDFDSDLNEGYSDIFNECLDHLKIMIKKKYTTKQTVSYFLSVALLNFEYEESTLNRLINIIQCKL